ncbi:MAG: PDZ domain-containing protein [Ignavibacteriota bacterium]
MKVIVGIGAAFLAASLSAFGQTPAPSTRARSANNVTVGETPYLGVGGVDITADRARSLKLKEERGVEVTSVDAEGSAAKAGVKEGDVVLEFNGQKLEGWEHLKRLVRETPIHREVKILVWRNGGLQTLSTSIGARRETQIDVGSWGGQPPSSWVQPLPPTVPMPPAAMPSMPGFDLPAFRTLMGTSSLGIVGEALGQESQLAEFFGVKEGVLVRQVNPDSAAAKAGMKAGDVITRVEDTAISTPQQIGGTLRQVRGKTSVSITVVRSRREMTLTVTPDANAWYRGGIWDSKDNILLDLFQPASKGRQ